MKTITSAFKAAVLAICILLVIAPITAKAGTERESASSSTSARGGSMGGGSCGPTTGGGISKGSGGATAPVNGGVGILALAGVAYGVRKFYELKK